MSIGWGGRSVRHRIRAAALVALLAAATAAEAGTITFDTTTGGSPATSSGSGYGNVRTFTVGGVTLTATAWSMSSISATTRSSAYLGMYGSGLGVTDRWESGSNNTHTVDNYGQFDFVQMLFSEAVVVTAVEITPYYVKEPSPDQIDRDITVSFGSWDTAARTDYKASSSTSAITHAITDGVLSDTLNVFANLFTSTYRLKYDGFKITSITVETLDPPPPPPPTVVPLPPAAFLGLGLLGGLGALSGARRRRARG